VKSNYRIHLQNSQVPILREFSVGDVVCIRNLNFPDEFRLLPPNFGHGQYRQVELVGYNRENDRFDLELLENQLGIAMGDN
jgi:hypothetical protein